MDTQPWLQQLPRSVAKILETLRKNGHKGWIVGGAVRDLILGRKPHDFDVVTDATPARIAELFTKTVAVGAHFGVMIVVEDGEPTEVATFRKDGIYLDSRRPTEIQFASPEEDAHRRDFTMNGIFWDPATGEVHDYVGGVPDIENRLIRTIGRASARFQEDALRTIRALRFQAQLADMSFRFDDNLLMGIRRQGHLVLEVSKERITEEMLMILKSRQPSLAFQGLKMTRMLERLFPQLRGLPEERFEHLCYVVDHLPLGWEVLVGPNARIEEILLWSAMVQFFPDGSDSLRQNPPLKIARVTIHTIRRILSHLEIVPKLEEMPIHRLKEFLVLDEYYAIMALYLTNCHLIQDGSYAYVLSKRKEFMQRGSLDPHPLVDGSDLMALGIPPGPTYGELLQQVRKEQLEERLHTKEEALSFLRQRLGH